jgi:uncharacterized protein DUF2313
MPTIGGYSPMPFRVGGGQSRLRDIYESLNDGLGSAYDTTDASTVTAETKADATTIEAVWSANERLKNQWDPNRLTDFLERWQKIFGLSHKSTDSDNKRRARVAAKFKALGGPLYASLNDICVALLGDAFVDIEYTDLAHASTHWPGGSPAEPTKWSSTIAYILFRVTPPASLTFNEFIATVNDFMAFMGDFLPCWDTFNWGVFNSGGVNGFLLDDPKNLDWETFDS